MKQIDEAIALLEDVLNNYVFRDNEVCRWSDAEADLRAALEILKDIRDKEE